MYKLKHNKLIFYYKNKKAYNKAKVILEKSPNNRIDINDADVIINVPSNIMIKCDYSIERLMDILSSSRKLKCLS